MLGLTFTKNHFSKNSKGEEIQVCEFEIRRFDGRKRYRFTIINRITFLLEIYNKNNTLKEIAECQDHVIFSQAIESILPRNPDTGDSLTTGYEFVIARTFWLDGIKYRLKEEELEKAQKKKDLKEAREKRTF